MKPRFIALTLAGLALAGIVLAWAFSRQPITIHARIAEDGGFMPTSIKATAGKPLRLRLISDDVPHTFAVGQYPLEPVTITPGTPVDLTLTFDKPGVYTYYTTTPSSLNFWRMRGIITVDGGQVGEVVEPPLYVQLGIELDEAHEESAEEHVEMLNPPSASRGEAFAGQIPASYLTREYYVAHAPMQAFEELRAESALGSLSDEDVWDVVAFIWRQNTTVDALANGADLYRTNCAACHGETGAGDGQFADEMKALAEQSQDEHGIQAPTDFTDPEHVLESEPAKIQGLILRGGMGSGMPMWGVIFTEEQIWNLVAYLYSFQLGYE